MKLRVWAPNCNQVQAALGEKRIAMERRDGGWWELDSPEVQVGSDYAYIVDGSHPLPDPRSPAQPRGVHGPSHVIDHGAFAWTCSGWRPPPLSSAVIYELHVGTFTPEGTFESAISRLDHLVELGVSHVELMPVAEFSGSRGWGYDGVALYAPHQAYGGPNGLKRLIDTCHSKGLAVLADVVYNHLGPSGNYLGRFGPYFTDRYRTPWGDAVNFDGRGSAEARRFFIDNAISWLRDYRFDGLRLDAVHAIFDQSAIHFLEELSQSIRALEAQLGRDLVLIAESDLNDPRLVRSVEVGGYGLTAHWNEDFHHALHAVLTGESGGYYRDFGSLADLAKALSRVFVYDGCYSVYRGHRHGRPATGLSGHRFVAFLQNHDQVGNRARGERIGQLASLGRLKIGAALLITSPFVPLLFQGQEWGASTPFLYFTDHPEPELAQAVREGRRREFAAFGWKPDEIPDPQAAESFERSKLDWREIESEPHRSLLQWYQALIRLRRQFPELTDGRLDHLQVRYDEKDRWIVVERGGVTVACNLFQATRLVPLSRQQPIIMQSDSRIKILGDHVELPPDSVAILAS